MLRAAVEGIKKRGNSDLGDKTLLDALDPGDRRRSRRRSGAGDDASAAIRQAAADGPRARRGDQRDARQARPGHLHRRAQHRLARRRGRRRRGDVRAGSPDWPMAPADRVNGGEATHEEVRQRPEEVRAGDAEGHRAGEPRHAQVRARVQPDHADRRPERRQGLDHPGLRLRPRAGARDDRRQGHARRRLSRRRVRRPADGLRARDHQAAQLAEGRAAPDQQLHRRPDGLRHGQGDGRGRGHHDRDASSSTTTSR